MTHAARKRFGVRLPRASYIVFVLIVGMMTGLAIWSLISASKIRSATEDQDPRARLQTELRALVGAAPLPTAADTASRTWINPTTTKTHVSWKWLAFIFLIGSAITLWAVVNHQTDSREMAEEAGGRPATPVAPLVVVPDWMKTALRASAEGIATIDAAGRIMTANPSAEELLGFGAGRLAGHPVFGLIPELGQGSDDLRRFSQVSAPAEVVANKKDGGSARLKLALHRVKEKGPEQYVAIFAAAPQPVPAELPAEAEKVEAERPPAAAALERAKISEDAIHDLENQIVMLGGYNEMILQALPAESDLRADAESMARAAARASLLCHEAVPTVPVHACSVDLNHFTRAVAQRLTLILDHGCEVECLRAEGNNEVWADPDLLERSLSGLAWRTQEWAGGLAKVTVWANGGRLELRLRPAGQTKTASRAAFDHLSAIDWIEKQNGTIEMEEQSEAGVRFRIWLPPAARARQPREAITAVKLNAGKSHAAD